MITLVNAITGFESMFVQRETSFSLHYSDVLNPSRHIYIHLLKVYDHLQLDSYKQKKTMYESVKGIGGAPGVFAAPPIPGRGEWGWKWKLNMETHGVIGGKPKPCIMVFSSNYVDSLIVCNFIISSIKT